MSKVPEELRYTEEHEWIRVEGDRGRIGVTDFAQEELGDVVYVELPEAGETLRSGESFGTIESVKAANDLFAPVSGEVLETNRSLQDRPELVNDDPYGEGWMIVVRLADVGEAERLLDAAAYRKRLEEA